MTAATKRPKTNPAEPVPSYDHDFYGWALAQSTLLREGRLDRIDTEHIAEEIEDLGRAEFNKLIGALRVLATHLLKWDHQPERRSRSRINTISAQRLEIADLLTDNPALKSRFADATERAYRQARLTASTETGLDPDTFPETSPYQSEALLTRDVTLD